MISEIFEFYYTTNMYPARLKPLFRSELCKGMPEDAVNKYLSLIKSLYDAFFLDLNTRRVSLTLEEQEKKSLFQSQIYDELLKHLFKHQAISESAYFELQKAISVKFEFLERPDKPSTYIEDSLDDFRLAFERSIVENDSYVNLQNQYLMDRYGYGMCSRSSVRSTYITKSDLFLYRAEDAKEVTISEILYWEAQQLLNQIRCDIERNADEQRRLDDDFCKSKNLRPNYIQLSSKNDI